MALPNVIVINILEFLRGDLFYRKRCVHTVKRGKRKRVCKHRPIKNSTFCVPGWNCPKIDLKLKKK